MNTPDNSVTDSYSEIGLLLRKAREETRMPIDQAARMLHIRVRYLDALEQGRLQELPGLTYTRGYLQAYAAFLGLDKEEILRRFEAVEEMLARRNFYFPQVFSKEKTPNQWMVWGGLVAALAVYVVWAVILHPPVSGISVVDRLPQPHARAHVSVTMLQDVACLREQDVLYPPCTAANGPRFSLTPLLGQHISVMELAQPYSH